jgi:diguanylate cyclase (GGDEF)-like protein/PAS domain S-box-containing protein
MNSKITQLADAASGALQGGAPQAPKPDGPCVRRGSSLERLLRIDQRLTRVLAGPGSSAQVAPKIVGAICEPLGWACGTLWLRDADAADRLVCLGAWGVDTPGIAEYLGYTRGRRPILNHAGIVGTAWLSAAPVWVTDMAQDEGFRKVPIAMRAGLRSALVLPVMVGEQVLGVIEVCSTEVHQPDAGLLTSVQLLSGQIGQFLLRAQALQQLSESEKRFRCLTALSSDWFWEQDDKLRFVRFEGRGIARSGAQMAPAMVGRRTWEVEGLVPGSSDWAAHRAALERREPFRDFEYVYRDRNGEMVHVIAQGDPIHDANGQFTGYRGTARDISVHKQAAQRIQYLATHDELTGLPNRGSLRQLVTQAVELAKRYERRFAVLLLNLDRFQRMNDGLGRDGGDALLRECAGRLQRQLRASDVVARLDGDEFAVLAHELRTPDDAEPVARKLLQAVGETVVLQGQDYRISACVGIAIYPHDAQDERALMKQASLALRAAKREGTNQVKCFDTAAKAKPGLGAVTS